LPKEHWSRVSTIKSRKPLVFKLELVAAAGSSQIGMYAENGSGEQISEITFSGIGIKGVNQQLTAQHLTFNGCTTGIQVIWDWEWVWKSITMTNVIVGFQLVGEGGVGNIGSVSILGSSFTNVGNAVVVNPIHRLLGWAAQGLLSKTSLSLELLLLSLIRLVQRFWLHHRP
jgi:hypothetical protein